MPKFAKVEPQVDFPALERDILKFWDQIHALDKLREKNRGKPRWSFLDGPITANNPMGVHHAWGRTYKDAFQRYFAMTGREERYQNGFDCQGLWVEVEVEKELKLQSKRDIENLVPGDRFASIDKFVNLCKQRVDKFARTQTEQSIRLGMWMNWDRGDADWAKPPDERKSYFTMSEENNYTIWTFLKKCHNRKLIYRGFDSMPWCPRCGVGLSEMEVKEGYKETAHKAVFVRFRLRRKASTSHDRLPAIAEHRVLDFVDLSGMTIPKSVIELVPESVARECRVLPLSIDGRLLRLATAEPDNYDELQKLQFVLDTDIQPVLADQAQIDAAIDRHYGLTESKT